MAINWAERRCEWCSNSKIWSYYNNCRKIPYIIWRTW